jgi:hypothetical protein
MCRGDRLGDDLAGSLGLLTTETISAERFSIRREKVLVEQRSVHGAAASAAEDNQERQQRDQEQKRMNRDSANERDDEQDNCKRCKHAATSNRLLP